MDIKSILEATKNVFLSPEPTNKEAAIAASFFSVTGVLVAVGIISMSVHPIINLGAALVGFSLFFGSWFAAYEIAKENQTKKARNLRGYK